MKFTVVLSPEAGGGFSAVCPALPGCVSQGDSLEKSLTNIREAIELCLEVRKEQGLGAPIETPELVAEEVRYCLKDRAEEGLPLTIKPTWSKLRRELQPDGLAAGHFRSDSGGSVQTGRLRG